MQILRSDISQATSPGDSSSQFNFKIVNFPFLDEHFLRSLFKAYQFSKSMFRCKFRCKLLQQKQPIVTAK